MNAKRKVLLVDDSALVRTVVVHALTSSGFEVSTLEDPRGIDDAVANERPNLLLVDATFPGVSDDQLIAIVKRHASSVPVVLFSDRPDTEIRALVATTGARGSLPKDGAALAERVTGFLTDC